MAKSATNRKSNVDFKSLTDCKYFIDGDCKLNDKCRYRHCAAAVVQTKTCSKWPRSCRNVNCSYRHTFQQPKIADTPQPTPPELQLATAQPPPVRREELISFFWDIENVPIPKQGNPFEIVQRIRNKLVVEAGLKEYSFSCFCDITTISKENQNSLFLANVRIVHVPDRKPGAADRQILLELDRFERAHRPPATVVLISGDIDFVGKLNDLRHQAGFHVIVIHNKPARMELKATVNAHYSWNLFTGKQSIDEPPKPALQTMSRPNAQHISRDTEISSQIRTDSKRASSLIKERLAQPKKPTHQCPKCPSEFESIQALRQHQEAKDHLFDCPVCNDTFVTLDGQNQHQKAKNHYSEYECTTCHRKFAKFESLEQHKQSTGHQGSTDADLIDMNPIFTPLNLLLSNGKDNQRLDNNTEDLVLNLMNVGRMALTHYYPNIFTPK